MHDITCSFGTASKRHTDIRCCLCQQNVAKTLISPCHKFDSTGVLDRKIHTHLSLHDTCTGALSLTHLLAHSLNQLNMHSLARSLTHPPTHPPNSPTHPPTHSLVTCPVYISSPRFTGFVQDAVQQGWFSTSRSPLSGQPDLRTVAMTALEVASAMSFLHSKDIVHGVSFGFLSPSSNCFACSHAVFDASNLNAPDQQQSRQSFIG